VGSSGIGNIAADLHFHYSISITQPINFGLLAELTERSSGEAAGAGAYLVSLFLRRAPRNGVHTSRNAPLPLTCLGAKMHR
jgi:hypothetical protein